MSKKFDFKKINQSQTIAPTRIDTLDMPEEHHVDVFQIQQAPSQQAPLQQTPNQQSQNTALNQQVQNNPQVIGEVKQQPTKTKQPKQPKPKKPLDANTKKLLTKIIIFIVAAVVCGLLAVAITPEKEEKKVEETPKTETQQPEETPKEEEEPTDPIVFDKTLSFDNGPIKDKGQINKTELFVPSRKTGVIHCETAVLSEVDYEATQSIYFYYENNSLKKLIQKTILAYDKADAYDLYKLTQEKTLDEWKGVPGYELFFINDDIKNISTRGVLVDLSRGPKYSNGKKTITIDYQYEQNIVEALKKVYEKTGPASQMKCSVIDTNKPKEETKPETPPTEAEAEDKKDEASKEEDKKEQQ